MAGFPTAQFREFCSCAGILHLKQLEKGICVWKKERYGC